MATGNVRHANQHQSNQTVVYYDGTATLERGYVLCYDDDATENGTDPADRLGFTVEKAATSNLGCFAGIYSGAEGSFTGPGYVTIDTPKSRSHVEAMGNGTFTAGATGLSPVNASWSLGVHADATINVAQVAVAAIDGTPSDALTTIQWL